MAINLASKYSKQIDERFKLGALSEVAVNRNYDWDGVKTINVYSIPTVAMGNYSRTGTNRYGTPAELDNNIQTLTLSQDRAFTFTIDKANTEETMGTQEAGKALGRQQDEVITPEIDKYRFATMSAAAIANGHTTTLAITSSNAYSSFLKGNEMMSEDKVPEVGRICFATPSFYNFIKQDSTFIKSSELAQNMLVKGQVGEVDGVRIIKVPSTYFPANHAFILAHPAATVAAEKLTEYKIHDNPPGINGKLVEGRVYYDAFVMNSKVNALYAHKIA
jgi:N4-gp56 family major capsid protein